MLVTISTIAPVPRREPLLDARFETDREEQVAYGYDTDGPLFDVVRAPVAAEAPDVAPDIVTGV